MQFRNQLGNPSHPAYNLCLLGIAKRADWNGRLRVRNNQQAASFMVAPTASVTIVSEFDEIDGAVMLAGPLSFDDPVLVRIDLDKCAGADQGIQRVILSPDVPVENIACSGVLRKKKR